MKNKYIFLIIAVGFGAYFTISPLRAALPANSMAQVTNAFCIIYNREPSAQQRCQDRMNGNIIPLGPISPAASGNNGGSNSAPQNASGNTRNGNTPVVVMFDRANPFASGNFTFTLPDGTSATLMRCSGRPRCPRNTYAQCTYTRTGPQYLCISCGRNNVNC